MGQETHEKIDPEEKRVRRVEARAAREPLGAERHPLAAGTGKSSARRGTCLCRWAAEGKKKNTHPP